MTGRRRLGGIVAGLLYERSLVLMVAFSSAAELSSIPILVLASRARRDRA